MDPVDQGALMWTRRTLLGQAATGLGTAALAGLLARDGQAQTQRRAESGLPDLPHIPPRAKRVIYLFQNGAPTHVDLFDYKPQLRAMHGQPMPESYTAGKRFSTMTGDPTGKLEVRLIEEERIAQRRRRRKRLRRLYE